MVAGIKGHMRTVSVNNSDSTSSLPASISRFTGLIDRKIMRVSKTTTSFKMVYLFLKASYYPECLLFIGFLEAMLVFFLWQSPNSILNPRGGSPGGINPALDPVTLSIHCNT